MKERKVEVLGHTNELFVDVGMSSIGHLTRGEGVSFRFRGDGCWVIPLEDLRAIVREADEYRAEPRWPRSGGAVDSRDPNERAVLERAAAVSNALIQALPVGDDGDVMPPVDMLDDVQVVACAFAVLTADVVAMLKAGDEAVARPTQSRCAWCVDAAADDDGRRAVPLLPWAEARAHVQVCGNNPMATELRRLRIELARCYPVAVAARAMLEGEIDGDVEIGDVRRAVDLVDRGTPDGLVAMLPPHLQERRRG